MGLDEVKAELLRSMQVDADKIAQDAEAQAKELDSQLKADLKQRRKAGEESLQRELEHLAIVKDAEARSEVSHVLLERKRKLIAEAVKAAKSRLGSETLKTLLKKTQGEIEVARVLCRKQDVPSLSGMAAGAEMVPAEISGGIIAENKDGTVSINYTYDELLARILDRHLQEIAAALFG
ncbi:MAG: V-type ATP synthase subunit E family protein [Nanoarchaeota archaeon]|nr:V-type ATP synthase subunit E family protein [Nanoarchaeota archaeon]